MLNLDPKGVNRVNVHGTFSHWIIKFTHLFIKNANSFQTDSPEILNLCDVWKVFCFISDFLKPYQAEKDSDNKILKACTTY